jgi:hypothetical protein
MFEIHATYKSLPVWIVTLKQLQLSAYKLLPMFKFPGWTAIIANICVYTLQSLSIEIPNVTNKQSDHVDELKTL